MLEQKIVLLLLVVCGMAWCKPIPIIIDTDIGQDFDDSWALALAVMSPEEVDIKMVLTAAHNTEGRAQIVAKYLTLYNRSDIPIGVGVWQDPLVGPLYGWAKDYDLAKYPGGVHQDGISAAVQLIEESYAKGEPITYIAIAPEVNFGEIVEKYPAAVGKVKHIYGMAGSIYYCYGHKKPGCQEYNVAEDIPASQAMFTAEWPITITPLDTCDWRMSSQLWNELAAHNNTDYPLLQILLGTLCYWEGFNPACTEGSDTLYDPTAMLMSFNRTHFNMATLRINVTKDGYTKITPDGKPIDVALTWKQPNGQTEFEELLVSILLKRPQKEEFLTVQQ